MKAVVLAAGRGKRLKGVLEPMNKCMLKFNGKNLIQYSLDSAIAGGADEIIIVVGYRANTIINSIGNCYESIRIRYVLQNDLKGLVDALEQARSALEGEDFVLFLADEILRNPRPLDMIQAFHDESLFGVCGVTLVEERSEIKKTYSVMYNPLDNRIYRLIEKPRIPLNSYMGTGNCVFKNEILDYIAYTPVNQLRHEKELPDLIQSAIDDGNPVKLYVVGSGYTNVNTFEDIKIAQQILAKDNHNWKRLVVV